MLSHNNIVSNVLMAIKNSIFRLEKYCIKAFTCLPYFFENDIIFYQYYGVSIYFGESIDKIVII
jgi:long-chain acyl-CoA synthetase